MHANTGALSELFSSGKAGTPVITQLASGELLLAKDNIGIFIGTDGKPSRKVNVALVSQALLLPNRDCASIDRT